MLYDPLPAAILALRIRSGLTRVEVAKRAHVREATWHRWETGARRPLPNQLSAILQSLGCTLKDLELAACQAFCEHCKYEPEVQRERALDPDQWRPMVAQFVSLVETLWEQQAETRRREALVEEATDADPTALPPASSSTS